MLVENTKTSDIPVTRGSVSQIGGIPPKELSEQENMRSATADQHLRTDHLLSDLKGRTVSSGVVTFIAQGIKFALNLGFTVLMARLVAPDDFGRVAIAVTVVGFFRVFKEAGLSIATVQREGITHAQVSNLFWINLGVSALITLLLSASAPVMAWFYKDPKLIEIMVLLSLTFIFSGSIVQHQALLSRQMRFKLVAVIEIGSTLTGYLTGVVMAWRGLGCWSLVGSTLAMELSALLLTWFASGWRPQLPAKGVKTRQLLGFGANLTAGSFLYSIARGLDGLFIGRLYGAQAVGFYSRATVLLMRPLEQFLSPINAVFVPSLSRLQNQPERYRRAFLGAFETIGLVTFPVTGLFLSVAHPLILVVLGHRWEAASSIFAGFTLVALYFPLANVSTWLFASQGRGKDWLIATSAVSCVTVAAFLAGLPFGPTGVAVSYSASCLLIQLPILYYLAGRAGPVTTSDLWAGFMRQLPLWGIVFAVACIMRLLTAKWRPVTQLIACSSVGLLAALTAIRILPSAWRIAQGFHSLVAQIPTYQQVMKRFGA